MGEYGVGHKEEKSEDGYHLHSWSGVMMKQMTASVT